MQISSGKDHQCDFEDVYVAAAEPTIFLLSLDPDFYVDAASLSLNDEALDFRI